MSIASIVNHAAGKIGELLVQEAKLLYGVEGQVRSLQEELMMMNSFLNDMEMEAIDDERSRTTIKQIRKIAYDAEDVIESYIIEASSSADKTEDLFKRYVCFCSSLARTHDIGSEIEAIKARIDETMGRWKKYGRESGVRIDAREGLDRIQVKRPLAYSHTDEDHVVGLDEDISKLVVMLTSDDTKIQVLSVVGMGGSGKTTLARKLYNHDSVRKHFNCMAWVSVSKEWVAQQILLELLRKTSGESIKRDDSLSTQVIVEKLYQYLVTKRYLIVLDDVWQKQALEQIFPALPPMNDGSKIIVTTRKQEAIDFPDLKCCIHEPRRLTEEECWELFKRIALIHREKSNNSVDISVLEALGREMLKKCGGLPLAVIALAGILGKKETIEEWEKINKAVSSRIMEDGRGTHLYGPVKEMLALSYNDLPFELKPCFLYLARYREDMRIGVGRLTKLWIFEGFIAFDKRQGGETLKDVARRYLDELIQRCMVQTVVRNFEGKVKSIRIHDLVRDLCIKKAKEQDFLEVFTSESSNPDTIVTESRRAVIFSVDRTIPFPKNSQQLRSLAYGQFSKLEENQPMIAMNLQVIHQNFRLLRVLLLRNVKTSDLALPTGIGSLLHLRYLDLWGTSISYLPSSIGNLRNLLTLDYGYARFVEYVRIPDVLWKIEGL